MEVISYNNELALATLLFQNCFRNIQIERTIGGKKELLKVNCVYGQRSRILKNLQNPDKKGIYKLPLIAINRTGISRNPERLNNLHNEIKYQETSKRRNYDVLTPSPIDLTFDVVIYTKYPGDTDRILSNFLIFFNSDIYVTSEHPKFKGVKYNNQIIFQDSISQEFPDELDGTQDDFIMTTCTFLFKTYIFGGRNKADATQSIISKLSTWISTDISTSIDSNGNSVSSEISTEVSSVIDTVYDGFIPRVSGIHMGYYAVPKEEEFNPYIDWVDETFPTSEQYDLFVDRFIYRIDGASLDSSEQDENFPNNVKVYRHDQLLSAYYK